MNNRTERIAALNDKLRTTFDKAAGRILCTAGFNALAPEDKFTFVRLIQTFNAFSQDNDPYGERDFGRVEHNGQKVLFKIDYYDKTLTKGSEDPADETKTTRVMTIMLAHEY